MKVIEELGYMEKGTGKHQSNIVYGAGGASPTICAALGVKCWIFIVDKKRNGNEQENKQSNSTDS